MYPRLQSFLVMGLSKSGVAAIRYLLSRGARVYVYDDATSERIETEFNEAVRLGAKRVSKDLLEQAVEFCDAVVLSPGIAIDHPVAVAFRRLHKAVLSESELAARYMRANVVAVTGTNGKTTTVSLLESACKTAGFSVVSCGNVGTPMLECVEMGEESIAVAEISSFQLETMNSLRPHIAVVLNVSEDHLDRHYSMENYVFLKAKLLRNLTESEYAVLNYDDERVRAFAERTKANVIWFSLKEKVRGAYLQKDELWFGNEKIMSADDLFAGGLHNVQDALACICCAKLLGIKTPDVVTALSQFSGVRHRIQTVGTVNGVTYVNDSKGTNIDATIKAIEVMKTQTVLLLGGKNKGYDYAPLFDFLKKSNVIQAVLYGENRYELLRDAQKSGYDSVTLCEKFEIAVRIAALYAQSTQTVLLSPASASFDAFNGYEERGDAFIEIVQALQANAAQTGFASNNSERDETE